MTTRYKITVEEVADNGKTTRAKTVTVGLKQIPTQLQPRDWTRADFKAIYRGAVLVLGLDKPINNA